MDYITHENLYTVGLSLQLKRELPALPCSIGTWVNVPQICIEMNLEIFHYLAGEDEIIWHRQNPIFFLLFELQYHQRRE